MDELAERFIEEETEVKVPGLDPLERARFHRLVRQCVANWMLHSGVSLRVTRGKYGMALQFEGPLSGKNVSLFSLRAHHQTGEYRFSGPNPDRKRLGLSDESLEALERLRDLYEALLSGKEGAGETVTVVLHGRMPDLVPLVEETRRTLDGGSEGAPTAPPPRAPRKSVGRPPRVGADPGTDPGPGPERGEDAVPVAGSELRGAVARLRLACPDPQAAVAFYSRLLKTRPEGQAGNGAVAEFDLGSVTLSITEDLTREERKVFGYGSGTKNRGWGTVVTIKVPEFDLCLRRARRMQTAVVFEDLPRRTFVARDPAGYLVEIAEAGH